MFRINGFFSEFWDLLGMCAQRHIGIASVQWQHSKRLILSCFLCSCQEWSWVFFPLSCLQQFITWLKTVIIFFFFSLRGRTTNLSLSWSSENTGVYYHLHSMQKIVETDPSACSWLWKRKAEGWTEGGGVCCSVLGRRWLMLCEQHLSLRY